MLICCSGRWAYARIARAAEHANAANAHHWGYALWTGLAPDAATGVDHADVMRWAERGWIERMQLMRYRPGDHYTPVLPARYALFYAENKIF